MSQNDTNANDGDRYTEPDNTFGLQVVRTLAERGEWGAIHFTAENATIAGIGPAELAKTYGYDPDPYDKTMVQEIATAVQEGFAFESESVPEGKQAYGPDTSDTTEPDNSFALAVVRELAARDQWGAIEKTAHNGADMSGLGPVSVAYEEGLDPDPRNDDAVSTVADAVIAGFEVHHIDQRREFGPNAADSDDPEESGIETPNPDAIDDHHRLNEGKNWGGHMVYAELARLERAGVDVQSHRIVETADDNHPDLLEIEYGGVSADTIESEHRYRHIDSTRYYGVASRPLSELPERDGGVNN